MGQPTKLIIKKSAIRKDGTYLIFLQYCFSAEQRVLLSTDIAVPPSFWNIKMGRVSKELPNIYGDAKVIDNLLTQKLRRAEDIVDHALKIKGADRWIF